MARVVRDHAAQYPDAPAFKAGESVVCGKTDPEAPGWIWCTGGDGRSAWVPLRIIQRGDDIAAGVILEDYDARELTVEAGETLAILAIESGWVWAENSSGHRGWIPEAAMKVVNG
jgi:hypothetical protein